MARRLALTAAFVAVLLPVSGAGGSGAQAPKRGGTVQAITGGFEPACLNLLVSQCFLPFAGVLEGAFAQAPDYSWRERLVSHVEYTRKPPYTLTYHIRPEARWSDGTPVTARDFVFTHEARLKHPLPEDHLHQTRIRSVRRLDAKTVTVVLTSRFAFWRRLFNPVLPEHALRGENLEKIWVDRIDNPKTGAPIGSGPFLVERFERGEALTLRRNPRYWGPHVAHLDRIVFRFSIDPLVVAELFRSRRADVGQWQFSEGLISEIRRISGVRLRVAPDAPGWEHLDIRLGARGHPALKQKLVRRALAYGIDRVAIVQSLFGDLGPGIRPLDSLLFRSSNGFYRPSWSIYRYRPAEARRLLEQAGCRRGTDGIYSCAGERLSLRFVARGTIERRVRTLERVQAQLGRAGFEVKPEYAPSQVHDQILETGDFDVTLYAFFGPGAEDGDSVSQYGCGGAQNYSGYCQRLVTRDLDQSDRILDRTQWARVLHRAEAQMLKDVPVIPLFEVPAVAAVRSTVRGYVAHLTDPTWNAENWWLDR